MNEILFLGHLFTVCLCTLFALKKGPVMLTVWVSLQSILANLFVLKQICLCGAHVTCSDAYAVGTVFGLNLLREYAGKLIAKRALNLCFVSMGFFIVMSQIHLLYIPSAYDTTQQAYLTLLAPSPRLLLASLTAFFLVQQFDLRLFQFLKTRFPRTAFTFRNASASVLSQGLDTLLFSFLGLYGIVAHLWHIIWLSFVIKLLLISLMSPLIHFSRRFVSKELYENM